MLGSCDNLSPRLSAWRFDLEILARGAKSEARYVRPHKVGETRVSEGF